MDNSVELRQKALLQMAEHCFEEGADLVLFPEAFQYAFHREVIHDRETFRNISADWQNQCSALAKKYGAYLAPWDYYIDDDGKLYNTSYILGRDGEFIGRYRKTNITYSEMNRGISRGNEFPVFDLDIGKVGMMICFDNYFPEVAATLGNNGAQLVLYPLYGDTLKPQWELKLRARAADHSMFIVPCQIDTQQEVSFTGIVDPYGEIIARLEQDNTYQVVDIDLSKTVWSNTAAIKDSKGENLREYLHRCRNYKAFDKLAEQGYTPWSWDEIYYK
jgi:predicted amidohydrolase